MKTFLLLCGLFISLFSIAGQLGDKQPDSFALDARQWYYSNISSKPTYLESVKQVGLFAELFKTEEQSLAMVKRYVAFHASQNRKINYGMAFFHHSINGSTGSKLNFPESFDIELKSNNNFGDLALMLLQIAGAAGGM